VLDSTSAPLPEPAEELARTEQAARAWIERRRIEAGRLAHAVSSSASAPVSA
jgi:hypothetical protein